MDHSQQSHLPHHPGRRWSGQPTLRPVNRWRIGRGKGHAVVHQYHH